MMLIKGKYAPPQEGGEMDISITTTPTVLWCTYAHINYISRQPWYRRSTQHEKKVQLQLQLGVNRL